MLNLSKFSIFIPPNRRPAAEARVHFGGIGKSWQRFIVKHNLIIEKNIKNYQKKNHLNLDFILKSCFLIMDRSFAKVYCEKDKGIMI